MKKLTLIFIFTILSVYCKGQELEFTFTPTITVSQDSSIQAIAQLWENYHHSMYKNYIHSLREGYSNSIQIQTDSIHNLYWYNNSEDYIYNAVKDLIFRGEQLTFSIRKYSDTIYEIHTLLQILLPENNTSDILFIYKTCALETNNGFKLLNYFDVYKSSLQNYNSENIEFYYPCGFNFDFEKVHNTDEFINQFRNNYNIKKPDEKIICVIGNDLSESNFFLGFDFTIATSENKYAGFQIFPRTILTCRQDHIHEFIHAIIHPAYPKIFDVLNEGIATYYGGTSGADYIVHRNNLQKYMNENIIDFSNPSSLWSVEIEKVPLAYIVGAILIEYALKNYGTYKVVDLLSSTKYNDVFSKLEISMENVNSFFFELVNK